MSDHKIWNVWANARPFINHDHLCKCDGCSGARAARNKTGINPKSGRWYSKYAAGQSR